MLAEEIHSDIELIIAKFRHQELAKDALIHAILLEVIPDPRHGEILSDGFSR